MKKLKAKPKKKTLNFNLKDEIKGSHINHTWALIVGNIRDVDSLNSANVKLVKILNRCNAVHILAKTFQTLIIECMEWVEKILKIPNNQMKNYYVLLVHFFQYILITLNIGKWSLLEFTILNYCSFFIIELQCLNVYFD